MNNETPAELIRMTAGSFAIAPDTAALEQISRLIEETAHIRRRAEEKLLEEVTAAQQENERLLAELSAASRPGETLYEYLDIKEDNRDPGKDDVFRLLRSKQMDLDNEKISLAKLITEAQSVVNRLQQEMLQIQNRQQELRRAQEEALQTDVADNYNSTTMKISLYKKMGVYIETSRDDNDGDKILVIDKETNDASVLAVDDKYLNYFISNYLWDRIGGSKQP